MVKLDGIFPPIPTAFDSNEDLSLNKLQDNLKWFDRFDLSGYLILGSNGEMVMLTEVEKHEVYEAARSAIPPNKLMLAGTGGQSTRETIRLTKRANYAGADAVLVLNPSYYKNLMTKDALVRHYHEVGDASNVPVIIYNMPACSGLDMSAEVIIEISQHENIIGLKDSGGNLTKMGEILQIAKSDFQVLAGSAGFLLPALSIGAVGGILALANIAPQQCIDIYLNYLGGNLNMARKIQNRMIPINNAITSGGGIPALKTAMDHLGLYGGSVRRPILPMTSEGKEQLIKFLNKELC